MCSQTQPVAVISGGTGYIGVAVAQALQKTDWKTASLSRIVDAPEQGVFKCDITDEAQVHSTILRIAEDLGPICACIHAAAAPLRRKKITLTTKAELASDLETNLFGAVFLAQACIPLMVPGAAFIGITSAALESNPVATAMGGYIPSKFALRGLLRTLAEETRDRVRVHAVAPGFLPGGLNSDLPEKVISFLAQKSDPQGGALQEVADCIVEICKDSASYPTGTSIKLPGKILSVL